MSLTFKPNSYLRPKTEEELSNQLKDFGEHAKIIAGGTGIYEVAHRGLLSDIEVLIDISGLNLSYISASTESLRIGAATTMSDMASSSELASRREFAGVFDALTAIQPLQVKNVATVGGAICTALPFFDLPVSLLSLDAYVRIGPSGSRKKLSEFLLGYFVTALEQSEFVREIELSFAGNRVSAFQKFGLTHDDWALINCGVSLSFEETSGITYPIVVFGGGVGEKPARAKATEAALSGIDPADEAGIKAVFSENVPNDVETVTDIRASAEYRLQIAKVLGARAVIQAIKRAPDAWKGK